MKYIKPQLEKYDIETSDIILTSGEGSMTVGDVTVTGQKDEFSFDFGDISKTH